MTRIAERDWNAAYRLIEWSLGSNDSKTRLWAFDLIEANPSLKIAASNSFGAAALKATFSANDPITANDIESYRIELYSKYAADAEVELARRNLAVAFQEANASRLSRIAAQRAAGYGLIVTDRIFDQLAMDDQAQLKSLYPSMKMVPISSVGKILSFQVLDKSTAGNNFGSSIGSALGQATYVDKSIARGSYSATGQLGAALIGAAIGSSLNKAPEQRFLISYGIQTFDGAIKAVVNSSPDGIAAPVGQCVHVPDVTEAEPYLCSDTLVGFLNRAGRLKQDDRELSKTEIGVRIRCKISSVATLMLSQSECSRLNGSPVTSGATQ